MHVITVNLLVFLFVVVLPLLSFLRHNKAFRGGAEEMVRVTTRRKRRMQRRASEEDGATPARRRWLRKRVWLRVTFALVVAAPVNYVVWANLRRASAEGGSAVQLCAHQRWVHDAVPWMPSFFFTLNAAESSLSSSSSSAGNDAAMMHDAMRLCRHNWLVRLVALGLRVAPLLFLVAAAVVDIGYIALFYTDGREYGLQTRHNNSSQNRFINFFKFQYYRPYVNWKCRLVRNYFSIELVASDGPLPLFRFPTKENAEVVRAAQQQQQQQQQQHEARRGVATSQTAAKSSAQWDEWDPEERAALIAQSANAAERPHLPLKRWSEPGGDVTGTQAPHNNAEEEGREDVVDGIRPDPEAAMTCTRYLFAAHPHGILPLCSLVALVSNVTDRDRILFVDNRNFTEQSLTASQEEKAKKRAKEMEHERARHTIASPTAQSPVALTPRKFTTTNTRYGASSPLPPPVLGLPSDASPAATATTSPRSPITVSPATAALTAATGEETNPVRRPYARARHYIYDRDLRAFRLIPARDEAVPPPGTRAPSVAFSGYGDRIRIRLRAVVASFPFFIPIMREIYLFHGMIEASYTSCRRVLESNIAPAVRTVWSWRRIRRGWEAPPPTPLRAPPPPPTIMDYNALLLFPGGASEALLSSAEGPARLLLQRRKGFVRLALQTGSSLVPCYTFGETDYIEQLGTSNWRDAAVYEDDDSVVWGRHAQRDGAGAKPTPEEAVQAVQAAQSTTTTATREAGGDSSGRLYARRYYHEVMPSPQDEDSAIWRAAGHGSHSRQSSPSSTAHVGMGSGSGEDSGTRSTTTGAETTAPTRRSRSRSRRPPRWVQWCQRLFQDTFGISFPLLKNILPHRCKAATVVGRPLYFELPPDLARMYTDPDQFYDAEIERAVVAAAQDVYIRELKALFDKYAPVYLTDHERRRLIIV